MKKIPNFLIRNSLQENYFINKILDTNIKSIFLRQFNVFFNHMSIGSKRNESSTVLRVLLRFT